LLPPESNGQEKAIFYPKEAWRFVLIEGVETDRQMRIIESLETIAEVQGFLFSPPISESKVAALLGGRSMAAA
jgi:EAL domain-containing protein (putative c-di-GMP-specific phosphodiesterase class I)